MNEDISKKTKFKNVYIILTILIGWAVVFVGAFGKITSTPWGSLFLTYGIFIHIIGCILGIIKILILKDTNKTQSSTSRFLLKTKYILLIILIGSINSSLGALGTITSMPMGSIFMKIGSTISLIGYTLGVLKLLSLKQVRRFLMN